MNSFILNNLKKDNSTLLFSVIVSLIVLLVDLSIPLGVAGGVPYVVSILLIGSHSNNKNIWIAAIITSLLVGVGYLLSPAGGELWKVLANRFLAVFVIWVTAILLSKSKKNEAKKRDVQRELVKNYEQRSTEREILLQEIHHRVKNNLQITASLLSLQSNHVESEKAKNALQSSYRRVNSMALVHEMLYQTEDFTKINYCEYLKELVGELVSSMETSKNSIRVEWNVPELYFNIGTAIPLGILINEIITNSIKHGFKNNQLGVINIEMKENVNSTFTLLIGDNGTGFADDTESKASKSLGLNLIKSMVVQLNGRLEKSHIKKGVNYIVDFQGIESRKDLV